MDHIVFARQLIRDMGYRNKEERAVIQLTKKAVSISDLRVIDIYEEAILNDVNLAERQGNWVQKYQTDEDAQLFAVAQFSRYAEVEMFLEENLKNMTKLTHITKKRGESS